MNQPILRRIVQAVGGSPDRNDSVNTLLRKWLGAISPPEPTEDAMLHQTSVVLDNTQILALPSVPVAIVPETETLNYSGKITKLPIIVRGTIHWDIWEGTPYGNLNAPDFGLFIGNDALGVGPVSYVTNTLSFFNGANFSPLHAFGVAAHTPGGNNLLLTDEWSMDGANHDNGLYLGLQFNGGNLTGGHSSNRLRVSLVYLVYNLQTGLFE